MLISTITGTTPTTGASTLRCAWLKAAKTLGIDTIPVIRLKLNGRRRSLFAIAENKTGEIAEWDNKILSELLKEFKDNDLDLSHIGFSDAEIHALLLPKEDFDWSCLELEMQTPRENDYVLLPVKIPRDSIHLVKERVAEQAKRQSIRGKNSAIKAGLLIMRLLGVAQ